MIEEEQLRIKVFNTNKRIVISYPLNFNSAEASQAFIGFSRDTAVKERLMLLEDDCVVSLITSKNEIIGLQIPVKCE